MTEDIFGYRGEVGAYGDVGPEGKDGRPGVQGELGVKGTKGSQGRFGLDGADGPPGEEVIMKLLRSSKESFPGLENFVGAVLVLTTFASTCLQPGNDVLAEPCNACTTKEY